MKLLEEIPGYEAEEGVLGGADPVVQVDGVRVVAGLGPGRHVVVRGDLPVLPGGGLLLPVLALGLNLCKLINF